MSPVVRPDEIGYEHAHEPRRDHGPIANLAPSGRGTVQSCLPPMERGGGRFKSRHIESSTATTATVRRPLVAA